MNRKVFLFAAFLILMGSAYAIVLSLVVDSTPASQSEHAAIDTTQINRVEADNERTVRKKSAARKQELLRLAIVRQLLANRQNVCGIGDENGDSCLIKDDVDNENNTYEYDSEPSENKADEPKEALKVVKMAPLAYFREQMFEEGEDPQWSPEAKQGIEDKLAEAQFPDLKNQQVSCSANVCKVTLQFNSMEGLDRTLEEQHEEVASLSTWESKSLLTRDKNDVIHLFFPREGYEMPTFSFE